MASCLHDLPALRAPSGRRIDGPQDNSRTAAHLASGRPVGSPADRRRVAENVFGNRRCGRGGHGPSWATRVGEARATDRPGSASTGKTARGDPAPCPGAHPGVPIVSQTRSEIHFSSFNTSHKHHPSPQRSHAHTTRGRKRSCWESRRCPVCTKCTQDRAWAGRLGPRAYKGRRRGRFGSGRGAPEEREPGGRGSAVDGSPQTPPGGVHAAQRHKFPNLALPSLLLLVSRRASPALTESTYLQNVCAHNGMRFAVV